MGKPQKKSTLTSLKRLFVSTLFVATFLSIAIHLIYIYSQEPTVNPQLVYLHRKFKKQPYSKIYQGFNTNKYSALKTSCRDCTNQIINYYGYKNDKTIVHRDYTALKEIEAQVMPYFWAVRTFIRNTFFEKQTSKVWVFWVNKQVPRQDIEQIKLFQPQNSIVIVFLASSSKNKIKQKGFKDIGKVDEFDLVKLLKSINFSKKQAEGYIRYHSSSIPAIFSSILSKFTNIQQQLSESFTNITNLSKKTKSIVRRVCVNGTNKAVRVNDTIKGQLESAGILIENNLPKWKSEKYVLNYMLQTKHNCNRDQFTTAPNPKHTQSEDNQANKCVCKPKKAKKIQLAVPSQQTPATEAQVNPVVATESKQEAEVKQIVVQSNSGVNQEQDQDQQQDEEPKAQTEVTDKQAQNKQVVSEPLKQQPKQPAQQVTETSNDDDEGDEQQEDENKDEGNQEKVDAVQPDNQDDQNGDEDEGDNDNEDEDDEEQL